jgi:hypothetical protein
MVYKISDNLSMVPLISLIAATESSVAVWIPAAWSSVTKKQITGVDATPIPRIVGPANRPTVTAHRSRSLKCDDVDGLALICERRDVERILGTIELAEETCLAIALAGDNWNSIRLVKDVGRTHVDTDVARCAALGIDDLDHSAASA